MAKEVAIVTGIVACLPWRLSAFLSTKKIKGIMTTPFILMTLACAIMALTISLQWRRIKQQEKLISDLNEKGWKETSERVDDYKESLEKQRKENAVLRKLAADFTPMKSMADYMEKIQNFSEQAEDMFGLYIDTIHLEHGNTMFSRYWKVDMKTSGRKKPKDDIEKQSADTAE